MKNTLETRLGLFFAMALVVAVIILELIGAADWFKPGIHIQANFANVQELKEGDAVKMAGVEIGRVEDITLVNGKAQVKMKINGRYPVKTDSKAMIKFTGLMGQNYVAIVQGSETAPNAETGATLETVEQPDLSAIMTKLDDVASNINGLTQSFSPTNFSNLIGPLGDILHASSNSITVSLANLRRITDDIAQGRGTIGKLITDETFYNNALGAVTNLQSSSDDLQGLIAQATTLVKQAQDILGGVQSGRGTLGKLTTDEQLYQETLTAMTQLREILQKANQGQGSVGKLLNDDSLYRNAKLGLQKLEKATDGLEDQGPLSVLGIAVNSLF